MRFSPLAWQRGMLQAPWINCARRIIVPKDRAGVRRAHGTRLHPIVPLGLDHILFVLGLFVLSLRIKPLPIRVTAFTVAPAISLALPIQGAVSLPPTPHAGRAAVVLLCAVLHGMGFAGVPTEVGLPRSEFVTGLLGFNRRVELGQVAVIMFACAAAGHWLKEQPWYRSRVVIPASALLALAGSCWTVERACGRGAPRRRCGGARRGGAPCRSTMRG